MRQKRSYARQIEFVHEASQHSRRLARNLSPAQNMRLTELIILKDDLHAFSCNTRNEYSIITQFSKKCAFLKFVPRLRRILELDNCKCKISVVIYLHCLAITARLGGADWFVIAGGLCPSTAFNIRTVCVYFISMLYPK
jgi:hypothetical protein